MRTEFDILISSKRKNKNPSLTLPNQSQKDITIKIMKPHYLNKRSKKMKNEMKVTIQID